MNERVSLGKVSATPEARQLLAEIIADHGPVLFHQSGGCCDGSSPMCYPQGDFIVGDRDVLLGTIGDTPVYISESQYEAWKHTDLTIDVVPGRGGMFSLDNGRENHKMMLDHYQQTKNMLVSYSPKKLGFF